MIIGIDIRVLGSDVKSGVEEYTENLLAHMLPLNKEVKFKLFHSSLKNNLKRYEWMDLPNVELFSFRLPNKFLFAFSKLFNRPHVDELIGGVDVFFSPHFLLAPLSKNCKRVTTFHDLSYIYFKEFFSWKRNLWHKLQSPHLCQCNLSDKIIAVSQSTKKDLIQEYGFKPDKISVVYSGVSGSVLRPSIEKIKLFKKQNKLPENFILFLGKLEPRKNILGVIRAFNILKSSNKFEDLFLVIVGSPGWLYKNIYHEAKLSPFKNKILFKNHVRDEDRKFYYSLASIFLYPSFFEGFGFPPLEAMVCGTPIVTSFNSSLPEVVNGAGILVDPNNIEDLSGAIKKVITDLDFKNILIQKGLKLSKSFTWDECAKETLKYLKKI